VLPSSYDSINIHHCYFEWKSNSAQEQSFSKNNAAPRTMPLKEEVNDLQCIHKLVLL